LIAKKQISRYDEDKDSYTVDKSSKKYSVDKSEVIKSVKS